MEFRDVVRRRHMVRTYTGQPVPRAVVDEVVDAGLQAPSAGFSQGFRVVVLEGDETAEFWDAVTPEPGPAGGRWARLRKAPVVLLPLAHKPTYLARYAEPDKAALGMDREEAWPVPYWDIDAAFAAMSMLLAATDLGLGALFFSVARGEQTVLDHLGVPVGYRPIGAITLGWPADADPPSPSLARGRMRRDEVVRYGGWAR